MDFVGTRDGEAIEGVCRLCAALLWRNISKSWITQMVDFDDILGAAYESAMTFLDKRHPERVHRRLLINRINWDLIDWFRVASGHRLSISKEVRSLETMEGWEEAVAGNPAPPPDDGLDFDYLISLAPPEMQIPLRSRFTGGEVWGDYGDSVDYSEARFSQKYSKWRALCRSELSGPG